MHRLFFVRDLREEGTLFPLLVYVDDNGFGRRVISLTFHDHFGFRLARRAGDRGVFLAQFHRLGGRVDRHLVDRFALVADVGDLVAGFLFLELLRVALGFPILRAGPRRGERSERAKDDGRDEKADRI